MRITLPSLLRSRLSRLGWFVTGLGGIALLAANALSEPVSAGPEVRSVVFASFAAAQLGLGLVAIAVGRDLYRAARRRSAVESRSK